MKKTILRLSVTGWFVGVGLAVFAVTGASAALILGPMRSTQHAQAAAGPQFDETRAGNLAAAAAGSYLRETIGVAHDNSPAVSIEGTPVAFGDMARVDLRFVSKTREMATSITSGVSFESEKDFWVASWERTGAYNVATGSNDGTAYVEVVLEDGTGKLRAAGAGLRQPADQARARGPLPSYADLFRAPATSLPRAR